jgi:hypothetical protein
VIGGDLSRFIVGFKKPSISINLYYSPPISTTLHQSLSPLLLIKNQIVSLPQTNLNHQKWNVEILLKLPVPLPPE